MRDSTGTGAWLAATAKFTPSPSQELVVQIAAEAESCDSDQEIITNSPENLFHDNAAD
jgi:hypothetical protein